MIYEIFKKKIKSLNLISLLEIFFYEFISSINLIFSIYILFEFNSLTRSELNHSLLNNLFSNTFYHPESINTLFELYWIIKIISIFQATPIFNFFKVGETEVASWEDDSNYYIIFHDSTV